MSIVPCSLVIVNSDKKMSPVVIITSLVTSASLEPQLMSLSGSGGRTNGTVVLVMVAVRWCWCWWHQ